MTDEAWDGVYESLGAYFSGQDLCGIFVCEGSCRRFRRQALFAAVRESFPDNDETLLYILSEDGEEILYRITRKTEERLQGYYCYFERNEAMQEYMMDNLRKRQVEKEELPGRRRYECAEGDFGQKRAADDEDGSQNRERKGHCEDGLSGDPTESFRERMRRRQEEKVIRRSGRGVYGLCASMAVFVFAAGLFLLQKEKGGIQAADLMERLKINASEVWEASARPEETGEAYRQSGGVVVEEIPGNVYPTEGEEKNSGADESVSGETGESADPAAGTEPTETPVQPESTAPSAEPETRPEETEAAAGVTYTVQAGDSLYSISRKFYGTESMVPRIQELNQLSNADLIKEGQVLLLP